MKAVPTTPQEVRAVYRAILAAAKVRARVYLSPCRAARCVHARSSAHSRLCAYACV